MNKIDHLAGVRLCMWGFLFFKLIADFKVLDFYFFLSHLAVVSEILVVLGILERNAELSSQKSNSFL